jgi:hypothetical protein
MNPTMAALAIVGGGAPLTEAGYRVLEIAVRNGGYVAAGVGAHGGHVERVAASAIRALVRRGYMHAQTSPDGGYAARLSRVARDRLEWALGPAGKEQL